MPAFVSALFIGCGIYAITQRGFGRVSGSFLLLCLTTAAWQGVWAVLFQVRSPEVADFLVKLGYLLIIFLPTSFYLFLTEICNRASERRYVALSFGVAVVLALFDIGSNLFVSGYYSYFFGYYPKAALLHPVHVAQTMLLAVRCFVITWQRLEYVAGRERTQIKLCLVSLCLYIFAASDYLCNYGIEFYPVGVLALVLSFICVAIAIGLYDLMNPFAMAASVVHEMQVPLTAVQMYASEIGQSLPALCDGYRLAVKDGLLENSISANALERIGSIPDKIGSAVRQSSITVDMFLTIARNVDTLTFSRHSIDPCIVGALNEYPFRQHERRLVSYERQTDFEFHGSRDLLIHVLFNLLKNSLWAINSGNKGVICIATYATSKHHVLEFRDTALGIHADDLPYIFDAFFSTRQGKGGTGVGLSFCRQVLKAFGGNIRCQSEPGIHATFYLEFPKFQAD